jgi:pimeloyl-ACP methyl ester carboxylesterase
MDQLNIEKAYVLGHSYGAYTALFFALENPNRVKKLILAEPPIIRWLADIGNDKEAAEKFITAVWDPMGKAFLEGGKNNGLEFTSQWYFNAPLDSISKEWYTYFIQNAKEWELLTTSSDAFPMIEYEKVKNLKVPTLLLSGALNKGNMNDLIDAHLLELIQNSKRVLIANAGHEMFLDNAEDTNKAIINFLRQ